MESLERQGTYQALLNLFQKIKTGDSLNVQTFREFFLPEGTPEPLPQRLYSVYARDHQNRKLSQSDFLELYYIFSNMPVSVASQIEQVNLRADFCFYMLKSGTREGKLGDKETFEVPRFQELGMQAFDMSKEMIQDFCQKNNLRNDKLVTKDQFRQLVHANKDHLFFKWMTVDFDTFKGDDNSQRDQIASSGDFNVQQ